ncbi:hypothetical protein KY361_05860 [Candidatus Woesearchaeota archaeon]|nr:hypothetical protein [Candidatus Woesearchaeota archaeon]
MVHTELSLDLGRLATDNAGKHKALIDFLRAKKYFNAIYLFGATDALIVDWLRGKGGKPVPTTGYTALPSESGEAAEHGEDTKEPKDLENSVHLFTIQDLHNIEDGQLEGEMIQLAGSYPNPAIAVYKARPLDILPGQENSILSGREFKFKDFEKRYEALRAIVRLL